MKTVIVHGQSHEGSTCHAARFLADELGGERQEFFLPRDFGAFCTGCAVCFMRDEERCPHHDSLKPLVRALDEADVIILASPVYVLRATGAMKSFLDHLAYRFMLHRPSGRMFAKQGVCLATTAGAGTGAATRDMAVSMLWWGVGKRYRAGFAVRAIRWEGVPENVRRRIERRLRCLAKRIRARIGRVRASPLVRLTFAVARVFRRIMPRDADREYWEAQGGLGKVRPWRRR